MYVYMYMHVCMYMYMYTSMYVYMYMYMYLHMYVYIYTHTLKAHAPQSATDEWIRGHECYPEGCAASGSVPSQSSA